MRERLHSLRRLLPPAGPAYELFDAAVFLLILGVVGYITTDPPPVTDRALEAPFRVIASLHSGLNPQYVWGTVLAAVAALGLVCSYRAAWLRTGYAAMTIACVFASASFLGGMVLFGASPRAILSAVIYGWIASRLRRDADYLDLTADLEDLS